MTTIEIKPDTRVDMEAVLAGVSKLDTPELEKFIDQVLAMRAKRVAPSLSKEETELLQKINQGLPEEAMYRLQTLETKRRDESLSEVEHQELLNLVEQLEQLNTERVQYLGELAQLSGVTVRELIQQLGIRPKPYA